VLLLIGLAAALLGPYEIYVFYLFSEGGRFHYDGFGFGSFMFANIAWQVLGYYAIAALLLPLGYGHIRARRWARRMMVALLWCSLIVGLPLIIVFLFMLSVKELSPTASIVLVVASGLAYLVVPGLLIRFYRGENVRRTFETRDPHSHWIETLPLPILILTTLFVLYVVILHVPLFLNGAFPLFGTWLSEMQGFLALDIAIATLSLLTWGVARQKVWAWWASVSYLVLLIVSMAVTLAQSRLSEILSVMKFPAREMEMFEAVPLHGIHFAPFIGFPLLATLVVLIRSKRHFRP
ncbi:MAG: hypothetical protein ACP5GX_07880, partial [Anaerolineae bacterium]